MKGGMAGGDLQLAELSIKGEKEAIDQEQIKPKSFSWKPKSKIKAEFFLKILCKTVSPVLKR